MRMWNVPAETLCQQHRLGEHYELHKFRHVFVKKQNVDTRILKGQIFPSKMKTRHDELAELIKNHKSPYELPDLSYIKVEEKPYFR